MDQTGSARSYPSSTTARCRRERKAQGPENGQTKARNSHKGCRTKGRRMGGSKTHGSGKENQEGLERSGKRRQQRSKSTGERNETGKQRRSPQPPPHSKAPKALKKRREKAQHGNPVTAAGRQSGHTAPRQGQQAGGDDGCAPCTQGACTQGRCTARRGGGGLACQRRGPGRGRAGRASERRWPTRTGTSGVRVGGRRWALLGGEAAAQDHRRSTTHPTPPRPIPNTPVPLSSTRTPTREASTRRRDPPRPPQRPVRRPMSFNRAPHEASPESVGAFHGGRVTFHTEIHEDKSYRRIRASPLLTTPPPATTRHHLSKGGRATTQKPERHSPEYRSTAKAPRGSPDQPPEGQPAGSPVYNIWTALPPLAEWIRRGQPAHTSPQRPPGAERTGRHKGRKRTGRNSGN
eukprot:364387-Chlamydomonas_euryale.AAC.9